MRLSQNREDVESELYLGVVAEKAFLQGPKILLASKLNAANLEIKEL